MSAGLSIARQIAYDAFVEVFYNKKKPDQVLQKLYEKHQPKRLDKNLAKEILYGSLRWQSKIFWILQNTSSRDLKTVDPVVQTALTLGTYQIFYMDKIPERAAVNESVNYVKARKQMGAASFANGILRQIARRAEYFAKPDKVAKPAEYLALQFAFPKWIIDRWLKRFKFEKLQVMLSTMNQPPLHFARINIRKTAMDQAHQLQQILLKDEKTKSEKRPLRSSIVLHDFPQLDSDSLFAKGYYSIQDEASQLITLLLNIEDNQVIVDACCGKGGKLSHIAEISPPACKIFGVDPNKTQLSLAKEQLSRIGVQERVELIESDFCEWKPNLPVQRLLIDAPCSGLGVLRRHPEGKWNKEANIVENSTATQRKLLEHGFNCLQSKGILVYSVCSFEPEEGIEQLKFLENTFAGQFSLVSPTAFLPDYYKKYVTRENLLLIYGGNDDNIDGFTAFVVQKN